MWLSVGKASAARHFPSCLSSLKLQAAFQLSDSQPSDQAADTLFSFLPARGARRLAKRAGRSWPAR